MIWQMDDGKADLRLNVSGIKVKVVNKHFSFVYWRLPDYYRLQAEAKQSTNELGLVQQ